MMSVFLAGQEEPSVQMEILALELGHLEQLLPAGLRQRVQLVLQAGHHQALVRHGEIVASLLEKCSKSLFLIRMPSDD
jgi:hypothetical protein